MATARHQPHVATMFEHCVLLTLLIYSAAAQDGPEVYTNKGRIRGVQRQTLDGQTYDEFLGVPYAKPPVGNLRWKKTQPAAAWNGTIDTDRHSVHCIQYITDLYPLIGLGGVHSEDCLYLNVVVPRGVQEVSNLPVMVWFYGGGFVLGTAEMYPGEELALHGDVIVISANYRVGVMGFMSTGDEASPGNYGLFDIAMSLQWVQDNIAQFGGDPERVTIFGESAGAFAVNFCMVSSYTNTLFQRGIALSGGNHRNLSMNAGREVDAAHALADVLGCQSSDTQEMVNCMRTFDGEAIETIAQDEADSYAAGAVLDNDFIQQQPQLSWKNGIPKDIDYITGTTFHDYAGFVLSNPIGLPGINYSLCSTTSLEDTYEFFNSTMSQYTSDPEPIMEALYEMYPDLADPNLVTRTIAATFAGTDFAFGSGSSRQAEIHSGYEDGGTGNTYAYVYQHRNSFLYGYPEWVTGSHLDDVYSVLGEPFMRVYREFFLGDDFNAADREVKRKVMDYFSNFAYTGNPNQGPKETPVIWPQFNKADRLEMMLSNNMRPEPQPDKKINDHIFWNDIWPTMIDKNVQWNSRDLALNAVLRSLTNADKRLTSDALDKLLYLLSM